MKDHYKVSVRRGGGASEQWSPRATDSSSVMGADRNTMQVYNLCSERTYDASAFNGRVAHFPFDDHSCPPMHLIYDCCKDIDAFLKVQQLERSTKQQQQPEPQSDSTPV